MHRTEVRPGSKKRWLQKHVILQQLKFPLTGQKMLMMLTRNERTRHSADEELGFYFFLIKAPANTNPTLPIGKRFQSYYNVASMKLSGLQSEKKQKTVCHPGISVSTFSLSPSKECIFSFTPTCTFVQHKQAFMRFRGVGMSC